MRIFFANCIIALDYSRECNYKKLFDHPNFNPSESQVKKFFDENYERFCTKYNHPLNSSDLSLGWVENFTGLHFDSEEARQKFIAENPTDKTVFAFKYPYLYYICFQLWYNICKIFANEFNRFIDLCIGRE